VLPCRQSSGYFTVKTATKQVVYAALAGNIAIGLIKFAASTILLTRETKAMLIGEAAIKNAHLDATTLFV
jgi:hypothetical protein